MDVLGERAVDFVERSREHAPGEPFFPQAGQADCRSASHVG
ncbi:hypothetical protein [Streptosporangium sp. V21-05]